MRAGQGLRRGQGNRESQRRHKEGPGEWRALDVVWPYSGRRGMKGQTELPEGLRSCVRDQGAVGQGQAAPVSWLTVGRCLRLSCTKGQGRSDKVALGMELRWCGGVLRRNLGHGQWLPEAAEEEGL